MFVNSVAWEAKDARAKAAGFYYHHHDSTCICAEAKAKYYQRAIRPIHFRDYSLLVGLSGISPPHCVPSILPRHEKKTRTWNKNEDKLSPIPSLYRKRLLEKQKHKRWRCTQAPSHTSAVHVRYEGVREYNDFQGPVRGRTKQ